MVTMYLFSPFCPQHYAYPLGSKGMHLILDERGNFRTEAYAKVRAQFQLDGPGAQTSEEAVAQAEKEKPSSGDRSCLSQVLFVAQSQG